MIITCPSCSAQYILPDHAIGEKGRRVKCTTCDYTWLQPPESVPEIGYTDHVDTEEPMSDVLHDEDGLSINVQQFIDEANAAMRRNTTRVAIDGIMYAVCALILTGILLVSFSDKIVAAWPESALLYEVLQIPVPPPGVGVEFSDLKVATTATQTESGDVAITGKLINKSHSFVRLPPLRVRAMAENGDWLKDWTINLGGTALSSGKEATLDYILQDAPAGTAKISLIFID